ncbi:MAG: Lrp/AsnC family transcriptional regulator [Anaerolineae bacterium]|nr:Lrp/AsnC family transcriptional regulator [Anaerolineae bacterium]
MTFQIDAVGWRILRHLQENARLSFRQIGEAIGLTAPAVAERVRRLEDAGLITGYHAQIDPARVGLPIQAFVHMTTTTRQSMRLREVVAELVEVAECHCVTGMESYILKVFVPSVEHLERLLWKLKDYGEVRTSLVLSSQVTRRSIDRASVEIE